MQILAINVNTGEEVAIKLEQGAAKHPQLQLSANFIKLCKEEVLLLRYFHHFDI